MNNGFSGFISILISQLPMFVVYGVGLLTAYNYRHQHPQAASRLTWAILMFVIDATLLSFASQWLVNRIAFDGATEGDLLLAINGLALARSLLRAWAFMMILGAIFPNPVRIQWPLRLIGGMVGLLVGGVVGMLLGDPIGAALNVTTFEGARGYFVVFLIIPLFAVIGAVMGVIVSGVPRPTI